MRQSVSCYRTIDVWFNNISICINEYSKKSNDCANYYSVLTQMMFIRRNHSHQKICDHTKQNYNEYVNARNWCEKQCPEEYGLCPYHKMVVVNRPKHTHTHVPGTCAYDNFYTVQQSVHRCRCRTILNKLQ